jgi:tetratricopeptide (TPR) repeat protein
MTLITAGDAEAAEKHLLAALAAIKAHDAQDTLEHAFVLYNVAQLYWHRNEYQPAFEAAQRSLAIAERLGEAVSIARAFEMLALACHSMGEWQQGLAFEEQRSTLAGSSLDVTEAFDVHL